MTRPIRILGIDPGLRHTGWGLVEQAGARLAYMAHGVVEAPTDLSMAERLGHIFEAVGELARHHAPDRAGVEETIVNANPRAALKLGQARGAAMAALAMAAVPVDEFAPRQIKLSVVGTGSADKEQVRFMVQRLLPRAGDLGFDAADALACAICTAHHLPARLRKGAA